MEPCNTGNTLIVLSKRIFGEITIFIVGIFFAISVLFVYFISAPVFVFRFLIGKAAKAFRSDLKSFVGPQGNLFSAELLSTNAPRCSLIVPLVLEGQTSETHLVERMSKMINRKDPETGEALYPEYQQCMEIWFGFAFWRNGPYFDIRNHIVFYNSGKQEKTPVVTPEELAELTENLLNKRFQPGKSPWEVYFLFNYHDPELSGGPKTVMIMRVHHTLADGYSLLYSLVEGLLEASLSSVCRLPSPTYAKHTEWSELWFNLTFPIRLIYDSGNYLAKIVRQNPFNVPDSKKAWKQNYGRANRVSIQKIKEIKDELGVTFTSILLAAISSSMSVLTKRKLGNNAVPIDRAAFFIALPVKGHPNALTNHATGAQIDLPMADFSDPIERVRDCDKQIAAQKSSTIPWLLHFLANTLGCHFSSVCGVLTANHVNVAGLTNFPVAINDIKVSIDDGNKEMILVDAELAAGALIGVSGMAFMALSYGKYIRFSVTAECSVLDKKDVKTLLSVLVEEIDLLHSLVTKNQAN